MAMTFEKFSRKANGYQYRIDATPNYLGASKFFIFSGLLAVGYDVANRIVPNNASQIGNLSLYADPLFHFGYLYTTVGLGLGIFNLIDERMAQRGLRNLEAKNPALAMQYRRTTTQR